MTDILGILNAIGTLASLIMHCPFKRIKCCGCEVEKSEKNGSLPRDWRKFWTLRKENELVFVPALDEKELAG